MDEKKENEFEDLKDLPFEKAKPRLLKLYEQEYIKAINQFEERFILRKKLMKLTQSQLKDAKTSIEWDIIVRKAMIDLEYIGL